MVMQDEAVTEVHRAAIATIRRRKAVTPIRVRRAVRIKAAIANANGEVRGGRANCPS